MTMQSHTPNFFFEKGETPPPFFCGVDRHGVGGGEGGRRDGRGREREKDSQWETVGVREGGWEEKEIQPSCEWNFSGMGVGCAGDREDGCLR